MNEQEKQRLLQACARAQREYEEGVQTLRKRRREVFAAALRTPISAREVSEVTGLSGSMVSSIATGRR